MATPCFAQPPTMPPTLQRMPPPTSAPPTLSSASFRTPAMFFDPLAEAPGAMSLREEGQNLLSLVRQAEARVSLRAKAFADDEQKLRAQLQAERKALAACVEKRRADREGARQHLAHLLHHLPGVPPTSQQETAPEGPTLQKLLRQEATFYELLDLHADADEAAISTRAAQLIAKLIKRKSDIDAAIGRVREAELTLKDASRRAQYHVDVGRAEQVRRAEWARQVEQASRVFLGGQHEEQELREEALSSRKCIHEVREALFKDLQSTTSWMKTQLESRWVRQAFEAAERSDEVVHAERLRRELMQWEGKDPPSMLEGEIQSFMSTALRLLQWLLQSIPNEASETPSDGRKTSSVGHSTAEEAPSSDEMAPSSVGLPPSSAGMATSRVGAAPSSVGAAPSSVGVFSSSAGAAPSSVGLSSLSGGVSSSSVEVSASRVGVPSSSVGVGGDNAYGGGARGIVSRHNIFIQPIGKIAEIRRGRDASRSFEFKLRRYDL